MPTTLHDSAVHDAMRARVQRLTPDAERAWGKMTVDQMLWHVNIAMRNALGESPPSAARPPLPQVILRFFALNLPWPKGAPTAPGFIAGQRYEFESQKAECLALIDQIATKPLDSAGWGYSASFGQMSGRDWSRLAAKHLDHHLRQFSV